MLTGSLVQQLIQIGSAGAVLMSIILFLRHLRETGKEQAKLLRSVTKDHREALAAFRKEITGSIDKQQEDSRQQFPANAE